ncbi:MAG: hypothetical protein ACXVDH_00850 [Nocardioides sp.]
MSSSPDPTTRESLEFLRAVCRLPQRQGEAVLAAGLAGPPRADGRRRLFDARRLLELAGATELSDDEVWAACPRGVFIGRVARHRSFHIDAPLPEQIAAVCGPWYVPLLAHLWIAAQGSPPRPFPFIATVGNFVVFGGEITGQHYLEGLPRTTNMHGHRTIWHLTEPGPWYDALEGRRLTLGPGYPWKIWGAPVSAPFDRTGLVDDEVVNAVAARAARRRGRPRPPAPPASRRPTAERPPAQSA